MEDNFLKVAKEAALEAGKVIESYAGKAHQKNIKNGDSSDFATEADSASEKKITKIIQQNFPDHNIVGEEDGKIDNGSEYTWVIDPIDGTFSFEIGYPSYGVSIGLLKNNEPIMGVIYQVATNELYMAEKGRGAYLNEQKINVSSRNKMEEAAFVLDVGHLQKRSLKFDLYIKPLLFKIGYAYSIGSAVGCLTLVAKGVFDGVVNQAWVWDFAAGTVIVREAGGKVTDFEGNEPDWSKERLNIVASNGLLHDEILEALKR